MKGEKRKMKKLNVLGIIAIIYLVVQSFGLRVELISGTRPEIKIHTSILPSTTNTTQGFNLEHAIKVHDNIHAHGNGNLRWQKTTVNHRGGTLGAYVEAINIFNEKDYRIYEVYNEIVQIHPELKTSGKEPYKCADLNSKYNMEVDYTSTKAEVPAIQKALQEGKLVQLQVHSNKWRNAKGEHVNWKGYHTGLIFYYDGQYFHMKVAGHIDQSDSIYTADQLKDWIGNTSKKLIIYSKKGASPSVNLPTSIRRQPINKKMDFKLDKKNKLYQMPLNKVSEGCCFVGTNYVAVCDINVSTGGGDDNGTVCLYNRQTGERYDSSAVKRVRNHSNSMTFDPKKEQLLIATGGVDIYKVNERTILKEGHLNIKGHGIAYDPLTDTFSLVHGNKIRTYSREEFYGVKSPSKTSIYKYKKFDENKASAQGLGAYAGLAFIPFSNKQNGRYVSNTILVFDIESGNTLTKLNTDYPHEIEDCMCSENGDLFCSDTMGNLFNTGVNVYRDLGVTRSGQNSTSNTRGFNLPNVVSDIISFLANITNLITGKKNASSASATATEKYAAVVATLERWEGMDGKTAHQEVIDAYNGYQDAHGKAGHHMSTRLSDRNWCSETASAAYAKAGYGEAIGGMSSTVGKYESNLGSAKVNSNATPKPGWIVCYKTSNTHTAVVYDVDGNTLKCYAGGTSRVHKLKINLRKVKILFYGAPFEGNP